MLEPILHDLHKYFKIEDGKLIPQISLSGFDKGFDKEEQKTIILAKANMLIYMSSMIKENPGITEQFSELFNNTFFLQTNTILGTLANPIKEQYDLILTNPPYVMSGSSNLKEEITKQVALKKYYKISAMGIEGLFMEWIIQALKPNGKAFVVVPDGLMNRSNDKKLRDYILDNCIIDAVISLPLNTFFTTNKKTYILALTKKEPVNKNGVETIEKQTTPVFTYLCSEIGESRDQYRFDISQNDLEVASDWFNMFKGAKNKFKTDDKRCKIVDIQSFYDGSHWCIEHWWTHDEKIELGIEDEINKVSITDFRNILSDTIDVLTEYDEPLSEIENKKDTVSDNIKHFLLVDLFSIKRGRGLYTKTYVNSHAGNFPVFSGNTFGEFAFIDSYDFDIPALSWAIDGLAGYIMIHNSPFSATNHRGILIPKSEKIDLTYTKYVLEPIFRELKKGRQGENGENEYTSLPPFMLKDIQIPFPVNKEGDIDLHSQREIANKYLIIEQCKKEISEKLNNLIQQRVKL